MKGQKLKLNGIVKEIKWNVKEMNGTGNEKEWKERLIKCKINNIFGK
mgnify:CR=1 FL=1